MKKIVSIFISILLVGCYNYTVSDAVESSLDEAGFNSIELRKALQYFHQKGDSLQLSALHFLIENMGDHSYVEFAIYDSTNQEIPFDVREYANYDSLVAAMDAMEVELGELHYDRKLKAPDLETITADLLVENIELAFQMWTAPGWGASISFENFCELILPYRGSNEPVESFRAWFIDRYAVLEEKGVDVSDPIAVASAINHDLMNWFKFDPRYYRHPTDQGLNEMMETGFGRCEDMTNLAIYAMRANGLPVTSDYTPYWADTGNNHAWNAILTENGMAVPFMGCEANPGSYHLRTRMAKAYRKTFSQQKNNLAFRLEDWEKVPRWLSGKYYTDVTAQYTNVIDIPVHVTKVIPDSSRFTYICVFNSGEWQAIHWGELQDSEVTFTDMGRDIAYLPMFYHHETLIPAHAPFIQEIDGSRRILNASGPSESVSLVSTTKVTVEDATEGKQLVHLEAGADYELFYWQDEWISAGVKSTQGEALVFDDIPGDALMWLVKKDSRHEERIFTWENGKQVWW